MNLKEKWHGLPPTAKRWVAVGGGLAVIVSVVALLTPDNMSAKRARERQDKEVIRNIITDADTRKVGIDSLSAAMQLLRRQNDDVKKHVERLERELAEAQKNTDRRANDEARRLREEIEQVRSNAGRGAIPSPRGVAGFADPAGTGNPFDASPLTDLTAAPRTTRDGGPAGFDVHIVSAEATGGDITVAGATGGARDASAKDAQEHEVYLPSGTLLTAVIITGVDAPTGQAARREPFPVMARLSKEAVLPNDYLADVRECFVILGAYGDLSSERAYMRGESLSCVRNDGKVIESKLDGFAAGEDGKNGVRGRLITRDGPMLVRAALAGFLQAWSGALGASPVPVIATAPSNNIQYQNVLSSDALRNAAAQGAGKAFEKLADYYLRLADATMPIIEIDSGRQIDLVLTGGFRMRLRD